MFRRSTNSRVARRSLQGLRRFALNKVGLIYLLAMAFTLMIFIIGGSKKQLVPHGIQNVAETGIEFVRDRS